MGKKSPPTSPISHCNFRVICQIAPHVTPWDELDRNYVHPKLVNDCLRVRLHHRLSYLSTREANLQPAYLLELCVGTCM